MNKLLAKYPDFARSLYPKRISKKYSPGNIYLTFDDGPIPEVTPWVLEQLGKFNAKACFFCIGANVRKYPGIFQRILEEGHQIGNHSLDHLNGWRTKSRDYVQNVLLAEEIIEEETERSGIKKKLRPKFFRPPYGRIKNIQARQLSDNGYTIVMWDVLSGDFSSKISPEQCYRNVIENTEEGSLVVFHDSIKAFKNLEYTLPRVLEYFSEKKYTCKKL